MSLISHSILNTTELVGFLDNLHASFRLKLTILQMILHLRNSEWFGAEGTSHGTFIMFIFDQIKSFFTIWSQIIQIFGISRFLEIFGRRNETAESFLVVNECGRRNGGLLHNFDFITQS